MLKYSVSPREYRNKAIVMFGKQYQIFQSQKKEYSRWNVTILKVILLDDDII